MRTGAGCERIVRAAVVGVICLTAAVLTISASAGPAGAAPLRGDGTRGYDRTYKCDLLERLPSPPQLVIFGGSRTAVRAFRRRGAHRPAGLQLRGAEQPARRRLRHARLLFWRAPRVKLRCIWALQAATLADSPLHPGLLEEPRLSQFLPGYLVADQRKVSLASGGRLMQSGDEYSARGQLLRNGYDTRLERGVSFETTLLDYLSTMVPRAGSSTPYGQSRARTYFERSLQLFNLHGVEPVLVIMPYHPAALAAFRAVGWEAKEDAFKDYLDGLRRSYRFRLLDYTDIASFKGLRDAFYDGAHIKAANARCILAQVVKDAPDALR